MKNNDYIELTELNRNLRIACDLVKEKHPNIFIRYFWKLRNNIVYRKERVWRLRDNYLLSRDKICKWL